MRISVKRFRFWRALIGFCLAFFFAPSPTRGQAVGVIRGVVKDSAGAVVQGVQVTAPGHPYRSITDEYGTFTIGGLSVGPITLVAKRLGFRQSTVSLTLTAERITVTGVVIPLTRVATTLTEVHVRSKRMNYTGRLAGYYERLEKKSAGYYITRQQIDAENSRTLTQLLQHAPGVRGSRGRGGLQGVRLRGRNCWPLIWFDGIPMPAGEVDLDSFAPHTLQGIELYLGSTTAPSRYMLPRNLNSCGTILLWSRGPDTDALHPPNDGRKDLSQLLASHQVYTADEVDQQASLASPIGVTYPQSLYAERIRGTVMAEFIVDASGKIEDESFGIIASSNPLFSLAARQALQGVSFNPAILKGVKVRQVVHQPFSFDAKGAESGG